MIEIILWLSFFGFILWASAWDSVELGMAVVLVYLAADFWYDYGLTSWIVANPLPTLLLLLAYAGAGGVWSLVKWRLWLGTQETTIAQQWETFKEGRTKNWLKAAGHAMGATEKDLQPTPEELAKARLDFLTTNGGYWRAARNKRRITAWIAWWPTSVVWTVADDIILELWNWVYRLFVGLYDRISSGIIDRNLK